MNLNEKLLKININDNYITSIIKRFEFEIQELKNEIINLKEEILILPSKEEVKELKETINNLKKKNEYFKNEFLNINLNLKNQSEIISNQLNETIFSVNTVVRAQNVLIEEKIFNVTKPNFEFTEIKNRISEIIGYQTNFKENLNQISIFLFNFLGITNFNNNNLDFQLNNLIKKNFENEKIKINKIEIEILKIKEQINLNKNIIEQFLPNINEPLPIFENILPYSMNEKPKFPKLNLPNLIFNYIKYFMKFIPLIENILITYYHQLISLSNISWEKTNNNNNNNFDYNNIKKEIEKIKIKFLLKL